MLKEQGLKPVEQSVFWAATAISVVALLAGVVLYEPLFYVVPAAFLFAFQMLVDYRAIFYLLVLATPFSIEYYSTTGLSTTLPTEPLMVVFMLSFIFLLFLRTADFERRFVTHPLTIILFVHFGWMIFTTIFAQELVISLKYLLAKTWYIVTWYFIGGSIVKNLDTFKRVFWLFFIPTLALTIYTITNHWQYNFAFSEVNRTMIPFFRNHVNYAVFLALMLPFIFFAYQWYDKYTWPRMLIKFGIVVLLAGIYFSYTRSSWLSVVGAFGAYFLIRKNLLMPAVIVSIAGVIMFAVVMLHDNKYLDYAPDYQKTIYHSNFSDHMESTISLEDVSSAERIYRWVAAIHMIGDKPWLGFGPGQFYFNYKPYTVNKFETYISRNDEHSTVHNYYLQVTVEQGFPGTVIWMILLIAILYLGQQLYHKYTDKHIKNLALALTLSIITIIVNIALSDLIEADKIGTSFFFFMAILVNLDLQAPKHKTNSPLPQT